MLAWLVLGIAGSQYVGVACVRHCRISVCWRGLCLALQDLSMGVWRMLLLIPSTWPG